MSTNAELERVDFGSDDEHNVRNIRVKTKSKEVFISAEDFRDFGMHIIRAKPKKKRILKPDRF